MQVLTPPRPGARNLALGVAAFTACLVPLLHDATLPALHLCGLPAGSAPSPSMSQAIAHVAPRAAAALIAFLGAVVIARMRAQGNLLGYVAELPLAQAALFVAVICSVALAVFDISMAFHGSLDDVARHQFCWLSGALAALGALLTIGIGAVARALRGSLEGVASLLLRVLTIAPEAVAASITRSFAELSPPASLLGLRAVPCRAPPAFSLN